MIVGMGIDIAEVERIQAAIEKRGAAFLKRIYTPKEAAYCERFKNKYERYAGRFAVKEAAMKALGTGFSRGVYWKGIEVVRRHGPPTLRFHDGAAERFARMGCTGSLLTLTHSRDLAIAHVLLLKT